MKILSVFGTRPEAIKMAPVIQELRRHPGRITSLVCVTGQHRQMLDQVLELFDLQPDYDLNLMQPNQSLSLLTASALTSLDKVLQQQRPDWVLTQGDTTTAMVASLAAFYHRIRVGHVEAGLRTGDRFQPFPEEINRRIADCVCDLHFAPTETSRKNLLREGIADSGILVTGNTVIDALLKVASRPYDWANGPLAEVPQHQKLILVTAHRRENFGAPMESVCDALNQLAEKYPGWQLVYPVHLNPNVQEVVQRKLSRTPNISLLAPLDYLPLVQLMKRAELVLTDSGGLQEEAPGLGKPVLVLRDVTERPEGVEAGTVRLVGTDAQRIVRETVRLIEDRSAYEQMSKAVNPYGDGHASERIVTRLLTDQR